MLLFLGFVLHSHFLLSPTLSSRTALVLHWQGLSPTTLQTGCGPSLPSTSSPNICFVLPCEKGNPPFVVENTLPYLVYVVHLQCVSSVCCILEQKYRVDMESNHSLC